MKLTANKFRVLNYRNIDDSGWIPLERVTAFVGRNEAGKTALLKALHKFNPAIDEPYDPQKEFPRDRFTAEYRDDVDWPVCQVEFGLSYELREELQELLGGAEAPRKAVLTRHYRGSLKHEYDTELPDDTIGTSELVEALDAFASAARRLTAPVNAEEEAAQQIRTQLASWADVSKESTKALQDLRSREGIGLLKRVREETNTHARPETAEIVETLQGAVDDLLRRAGELPIRQQLKKAIEHELPTFIYFENYGILDSAVYLPRFLRDLSQDPGKPRVRTINAMFKHVQLTAQEILDLGREASEESRVAGQQVTPEMIANDQSRKDLRSVKLNSASTNISNRFSEWFGQRRHKIRYQADGRYFRIWVCDDRRSDVEIELESRSKGFQWFFSFYLVFLVESQEGHKDAILLLDEPGLHLHPTAQQELLEFFERLSDRNPLVYTTHSPFLIDGEQILRVRAVTEDESGHSRISAETWPEDRETIFPLQAAAGYAMLRGLFQRKQNVLVEGMTDYLYLHALNLHCHALNREGLPEDVYVTPCGGTKYVGHIASLFLGQKVRPVVLLDGDDAGRVRHNALMKELYSGHENAVLLLSEVLDCEECEIEDIVGEEAILPALRDIIGEDITLQESDRDGESVVQQIKGVAESSGIALRTGWKQEVARRLVVEWSAKEPSDMPTELLDRAEKLFVALTERFDELKQTQSLD